MADLSVNVPASKPRVPCPSCGKESKRYIEAGKRICVTKDCPGGTGPDGRTIFDDPEE